MKKTKKCMSVLLAGMIAASAIPAVSATGGTTAKQPCVVDYFNSFNGFVKAKDNGSAPQGFDANNLQGLGYRTGGLASETSADGNTCLKFGIGGATNHSGMMMKYDETIYSGKLRISFDLKINNTAEFNAFTMTAIDAFGNNNVDDWMVTNGTNTYQSNTKLMTINTNGIFLNTEGTATFPLTGENGIGTDWHKYEFVFDFDNNTMSFALDLSEEKVLPMGSDFKTLDFITSTLANDPANTTPIYMDNLFIKHYPDGVLPGPEAIVDYAPSGVPSENAVVYVSYSEGLNILNEKDKNPTFLDFVAVNTETGAEVEAYDVEKEGGALKITFDALPVGTYKIKCDAPDNYKTDEGKAPADSNTFSTAGAAQNVKAENVLISDDFENYNGGMPANAVSTSLDKSYSGSLTAVSGKNGTGLKIDGNNGRSNIVYQLPYAVKSGKLTYEFDVNHTNGLWFTGILGAECFETDTISASLYGDTSAAAPTNATYTASIAEGATDAEKQAWATAVKNGLRDLRESTVGVGVFNPSGKTITADIVQAGLSTSYEFNDLDTSNGYTNTVAGLTTTANTWNHVKVEIDLDAAVYNITVGETTKTFKVYQDRLRPTLRYKIKNVNGTDYWVKSLEYGIEGISLGKFNGKDNKSDVIYDNLKVYTDSSYNHYSDFNGDKTAVNKTVEKTYNQPASIVKWDNPQHTWGNTYSKFAYGAGKDAASNTSDKALRFAESNWGLLLNRPISANTPFQIEFDIKPEASQTWTLRLMRKEQLYGTFESTPKTEKPFEAMESTAKGIYSISGNWQEYAGKQGWCVLYTGKTDDKYYLKSSTGYVHYGYPGYDSLEITNYSGWNHIKLVGQPKDGKIYVTAYVNNTKLCDGWSTNIPSSTEIAAIGLNNGDASAYISLDNLTVKQLNSNLTDETVSNVYVTDMTTVNIATAEEAPLAKGLAAKGQDIKINFSGAIDSADAIKVYKNAAQTTEVSVTKTLSADKKTVTISFADGEIAKGDKLTVEVPNTLKPDSASALSLVEPTAAAFEVVDAVPEELKIENFRLYKYYEGGNYTASKPSEGKWVPVSESELKDLTAADRFKFFAKGYNTGDTQELYLIRANKENDGRLKSSALNTVSIASGVFSEASLGGEFTLHDLTGKFNAYLWEKANLNPLYVPVDITLTKTPEEAAE